MEGGAPIQHLGAASREEDEPESLDGDFASSAEAEAALAAGGDFDTELTEQDLQTIFMADTAARELGTIPGGYVTEGTEDEYEGSGDAIFAQARGQEPRAEEADFDGSTPSHIPPQTKAVIVQTPGHLGSMPTGPYTLTLAGPPSSPRPVAERPTHWTKISRSTGG